MSSLQDSKRKAATDLAKYFAKRYPEKYFVGDDFVPHRWVVEAILWAQEVGYENGFAAASGKVIANTM